MMQSLMSEGSAEVYVVTLLEGACAAHHHP
jgi:hypothetical protein